jgi:hypothetical protein
VILIKTNDKQIRASKEAWNKLRNVSFNDEKSIKKVLDEIIIDGIRDPITGKII